MLKSLQIKASIAELKDEIAKGISEKLDMTEKAKELECLATQYADAIESEKQAKQKTYRNEDIRQMTNIELKKGLNRAVKALLTGRPVAEADKAYMPKVVAASGNFPTDDNGSSYLIPEETMELYRFNEEVVDLTPYLDVIEVSAPTGKAPTIDYSQDIELIDFVNDNDTEIARKMAAFGQIPFTINTRGALIPVARELIQDAATDVVGEVYKLFRIVEIKTTNKDALTAAQVGATEGEDADFTTVAVIDSIKDALKAKLPIGSAGNAKIVMCQSDFAIVSNLKDEEGRYYIQPLVTDPAKNAIEGHEIIVVEDGKGLTVGKILVGNLKQIKKLNRVGFEIAADASAGFNTNSVMVRAIARFACKNFNPQAFVVIANA